MLGNFCYHNPTRVWFGKGSLSHLKEELAAYGKRVQLIYGGGSIKKNGIYDAVLTVLRECGKEVTEDGGVMPNPTTEKLAEGARIARESGAELLLAVGGGSVCDYAKAVAASAYCKEDPWKRYYLDQKKPDCKLIPVGCVLTMVGTGSEMNGGSVITNPGEKLKIGHVFGSEGMPKFTILDPTFTYTVPKYQMVAGIYDAFNHICEQYFSGEDDNVTDYLAEGLMRSIVNASRKALKNPYDYEARSNIMWAATWALNTLLDQGKDTDWEVHMLGQAVGAYTDATHGMTLSAVSLPYYRLIIPYGLKKFRRFAVEVWRVDEDGTDEEVAMRGLEALEGWMDELGAVKSIRRLGVTEDMIEGLADATLIKKGGYKVLTRDEIVRIFRESLSAE